MTNFENLKSQWIHQSGLTPPEDGVKKIAKKVTNIKKKQWITNVILGVTVLVLGYFFFYISAYNENNAALGLSLMIGSLLVRITLEVLSIRTLSKLDSTLDVKAFKYKLISYYKNRVFIHGLVTPVVILVYSLGFVVLLPLFKIHLSSGFYTYVVICFIVVMIILIGFIGVQIRRELHQLRALKTMAMDFDKNP